MSFTPDERNRRTVMEVVASDRPGLLSSIGWALADTKVRLQNAKIVTFGERAEDIFYVTDSRNRLLDPSRYDEIAERVRESIDDSK